MAEINLVAAFSTVPAAEAEAIKQVLPETLQQISPDASPSERFSDGRWGMAPADDGVLLYLYRGALFKIADGVQVPKAGSLFFCRHLEFRSGERALELGCGAGLATVLAAKAGCRVVATDVVPEAVECARENAILNGVADRVEVRLGGCDEPAGGG